MLRGTGLFLYFCYFVFAESGQPRRRRLTRRWFAPHTPVQRAGTPADAFEGGGGLVRDPPLGRAEARALVHHPAVAVHGVRAGALAAAY